MKIKIKKFEELSKVIPMLAYQRIVDEQVRAQRSSWWDILTCKDQGTAECSGPNKGMGVLKKKRKTMRKHKPKPTRKVKRKPTRKNKRKTKRRK